MAYGNTTDIRTHVLGDLYMLTGTFTDGGKEVSYADHLSEVLAAGGHLTSLTSTGIQIDGTEAANQTALTVKTIDARAHLIAGQSVYDAAGVRRGIVATVDSATQITITGGGGTGGGLAAQWLNNEVIYVLGANKPSVTLISTSLDVSVDETNKLIQFECGSVHATTHITSTSDGRWWILGKR